MNSLCLLEMNNGAALATNARGAVATACTDCKLRAVHVCVCPIQGGKGTGVAFLWSTSVYIYMRRNASSFTEDSYSGWPYTEGRVGGGHTHQLTVLTAHRHALIMPITRDTAG